MSSFSARPNSSSAEVCEDAVRNPFLRSINNVNVALPLGSGGNASNVRSSCKSSMVIQSAEWILQRNKKSHHQAQSHPGKIECSLSAYPEGSVSSALYFQS